MVTTVHNQECIIQSHYSHSSNFIQEHIIIMYDIHVSHCYFTRCVNLGVHYTYISSFPFSIYIYIIVVLEYRSLVLKHVKHLMSSVSYNMDWICDIGTCF